jgi:hypothetical protein
MRHPRRRGVAVIVGAGDVFGQVLARVRDRPIHPRRAGDEALDVVLFPDGKILTGYSAMAHDRDTAAELIGNLKASKDNVWGCDRLVRSRTWLTDVKRVEVRRTLG